jgi:hypothetical protein
MPERFNGDLVAIETRRSDAQHLLRIGCCRHSEHAATISAALDDMARLLDAVRDYRAEIGKEIDAVEKLVTALYLYPDCRLDSRGPYGCVLDAIEALDPEAAAMCKEWRTDELYEARYAEKDEIGGADG